MPFKKGDVLRQKAVVIVGKVIDVQYDADTGEFRYLLAYGEGEEATQRWFDQDHVEKQPEEAAK